MPDVLHFACDMSNIDMDQMLGPDFGGRYLGIKHIIVEDGISTVILRGIMPPEFRERVTPRIAEQQDRERIRKLFRG